MLKNLKLGTKLNLFLLFIFALIVIVSGVSLSIILERNAQQVVTEKALLLIETMSSVRQYTSTQVNPELAPRLEIEDRFLPQTVPGYSAREVFENLRKRKQYNDFFYKEATLNPTNLRDQADEFETQIVETFREQSSLKEKTGFRSIASGDIFYIARPISVSEESCLRCHGNPEIAPKSQLITYGDQNGYGWKLNEIVGAQIISVPASQVFNNARKLQLMVIGILVGCLLLAIVSINFFLKYVITQPLQKMSQWAKKVSTADNVENMPTEFNYEVKDEIGILAASLNRLKVSLEIAMNMLNSGLEEEN